MSNRSREELEKEIDHLKNELKELQTKVLSGNHLMDEHEMHYSDLFNNTLNGVALHEMIYDEDGNPFDYKFIDANPAFEEHTSLVPSEIIGKTVREVIPGIEDSPFIGTYGKIAMGGEPLRFEQFSEQLAKHYDIYVFSPRKNYFITIFMDITDRKTLEIERENRNQELERLVAGRTKELEEAQQKLIRSERLALIGELTGGVGHEIRNPIAGISNAVFYLQNVISNENPKVHEYLKLIDEEVKTIEGILADLLSFSKVITPDKSLINLERTISQTVERIAKPDNILVNYYFPDNIEDVFIDEGHFRQIIENLYTNAMQAMLDGGAITFKAQASDDEVVLKILDEGSGITEENLGKIFEPLFTTKSRGIGLGLALVKRYIEANGCRINVISEVGQGTSFTINIPV